MIKRFSPNNARRFRQNSLSELNESMAAVDNDIDQIVDEVSDLGEKILTMEFDDTNSSVVFSLIQQTPENNSEIGGNNNGE